MAVLEVDKYTFEAEVLQAEGTVFVDYYAEGCVPCAALRPYVDRYAEKYGDKIKFCALNTTRARRLAVSQGILGLPVMAVYQNGQKAEALVMGEATADTVREMIEKYC